MIPLAMIPLRAWAYVGCVIFVCMLGAWFVSHERDIGRAEVQTKWDAERDALIVKANLAEAANETETNRRIAAQTEIAHDAIQKQAAADLDARRARAAHDSLLYAAQTFASRCVAPGDPAPANGGEATAGPGLVLPKLLGRVDDTAGELAAGLDAARTAGIACERSYDALTQR
jgi:hypothetical protein